MILQELLTPYPQKTDKLSQHPLPAVPKPFAASWYIRMIVLIFAAFFACQAIAEEVKNLSVPIVVQFSNAGIAPASPEFASDLSREVGVTLSYLQQTSEGRQIFQVNGLFAGFRLNDVLQRLQRRADVISAVEGVTDSANGSAQIIVKFSTSVIDPSQPAFALALSKDVGVTLAYLFEKTRGIQVFRVNGLSQSTQLAFILQRLKKRKDVLSAEASL